MELIANQNIKEFVQDDRKIVHKSSSKFIEANTIEVNLNHLKNDCIIPVYAKDNQTAMSHYEFINSTREVAQKRFKSSALRPSIRVSHQIKGRIPSAMGKPVKELLEHEKTIYYERMMFLIEIPNHQITINNQVLNLTIGGVRSFNQENLYAKKSIEKFKVFIGYKNTVCTNLCISTDGLKSEVRVSSLVELKDSIFQLIEDYNNEIHHHKLASLNNFSLNENQFAHLIGKMRMYHFLTKTEKEGKFPIQLTDSQIGTVVKDYFNDSHFKQDNGSINLWNIYNLFTGANKSSYIDSNLERNVNAYEFIQNIGNSIKNKTPNWFLHN